MELKDAKTLAGQCVLLTWLDRKGETITKSVDVYEANFVPLYGPCLITSAGDIQIQKVVEVASVSKAA